MKKLKPKHHIEKPQTDIYVGDNRKVLPQLEKGSIDLIFADPPFNWDFDYGKWGDKMPRKEYLKFTYEWLDACNRALSSKGSLWVNIPDDTVAEIVIYLKEKLRLNMINWCIWHFRFGQCRSQNFIVSKVHVLYFAKDAKNRIWNPEQIMEPSDRATTYGDPRTRQTQTPGLRVPFDVWYGPYWGRIQGNNKERRSKHVNQIPEAYMERVIRACSREDDLVLDPFLGSGTTCTVARALGRRSIGIEYSATIAKSAFSRIKKGSVRVANTFEKAIERAFFTVHDGHSSEDVIISDSLRKAFLNNCKKELISLGVEPKNEFECNWMLENLRKSGRLGPVFNRGRKGKIPIEIKEYKLAKEVVSQIAKKAELKSIDRVMCEPKLRRKFDQMAQAIAPGINTYAVRKAALNIRKKSQKHD